MPFTKYVIYYWYIDKNIFTNYKPLFDIKKTGKNFIIIDIKFYIILQSLFLKKKQEKFQVQYKNNY